MLNQPTHPIVNSGKHFLVFLFVILLIPFNGISQGCDDSQPPVVFVHGFLASGDTWTSQIQRFASNGHCEDRYFAFDWNSTSFLGATDQLDQFIDSVLLVTDASQIHLVGHSAGGGEGYTFLSDADRAAKVISYAHVGSSMEGGPAGPGGTTPTLNIWSTADGVVDGGDIPGAENVQFSDLDHYQVATSAGSFEAIYEFFYGSAPATTAIESGSTISIGGRCVSIGENQPAVGAMVEVFAVDNAGDPTGDALATYTIGPDGFWGPLDVSPNTYYLFMISSSEPGFRKLIYYYQPFIRNNPTVYLRTFPDPFSLVGFILSDIPSSDDQSVISIFTSTQAVINGRDQLSMEGYDLATEDLASAEASMIALFCYDNDGDGAGNGEPMSNFEVFPFLQGADVPISPEPAQTWTINFNGASMPVRNWRSASDGVVIAVFRDQEISTGTVSLADPGLDLELWPNPAGNEIRIHLDDSFLQADQLQLVDILGRQLPVSCNMLEDGDLQLNTAHLPTGMYFVTIRVKGGTVSTILQLQR